MENKKVQCCWSEVVDGKHLNQCTSMETTRDIDNHQERYFCIVHMKKVKLIRNKMNAKEIQKFLEICMQSSIIEKILNGEFK